MVTGINWRTIEQPDFDRVIEALMCRVHSRADDIQVVDGRGGDGGRDIIITNGGQLHIMQLKCFNDGLTARGRKGQITRFYIEAMKHKPARWTLVVPCNLTVSEDEWVKKLPAKNVSPEKLELLPTLGRAQLDNLLSQYSDLITYFLNTSDGTLLEKVKVYQAETAMLQSGMKDISRRFGALQGAVDDIDPHWTVETSRHHGITYHHLVGKHPWAHKTSPVTLTLEVAATEENEAEIAVLNRFLGFGTPEKVSLSRSTVERFRVEGPKWLSEDTANVSIMLAMPPRNLDGKKVVELAFTDENGVVTETHSGAVQHLASGSQGVSLTSLFHGGATVAMLIAGDRASATTVQVALDLDGVDVATSQRAIALMHALRSPRVSISVDGQPFAKLDAAPQTADDRQPPLDDLAMLLDDLDVVQRHANNFFPVPHALSGLERADLRVARLMIEGRYVAHPIARNISATLHTANVTRLRQALTDGPQALILEQVDSYLTLGAHRVRIGHVNLHSRSAVITNRAAVTAALERDAGSNVPLVIEATGGDHFYCYMPERLAKSQDQPTPWGLPGLDGPSDLHRDA